MGSFWGHIDEGIFFVLLSLWWMFNCYREYIMRRNEKKAFIPIFSYPLPGKRKIPLEIYFKIAFPVVGFLAEVIDSGAHFLDKDGNFTGLNYMQHMTIYGIFILHSLTDLMTFYGGPLIEGTHYLTAAIAFIWYGVAFYFHGHMHGKAPLETVVHVLPIPAMLVTGVTVLLEMFWRKGVATTLVRTYFVLTLGTWFSHVAFILYDCTKFPGSEPSNYDRNDHRNVAFATAAFGMHLCFNIVFMIVCYIVTYYVMRLMYGVRLTNHYYPAEYRTPKGQASDEIRALLFKD